jgi:hypothetical protein
MTPLSPPPRATPDHRRHATQARPRQGGHMTPLSPPPRATPDHRRHATQARPRQDGQKAPTLAAPPRRALSRAGYATVGRPCTAQQSGPRGEASRSHHRPRGARRDLRTSDRARARKQKGPDLTVGAFLEAGVPGLEPRTTEPESVVLPITPYPNDDERQFSTTWFKLEPRTYCTASPRPRATPMRSRLTVAATSAPEPAATISCCGPGAVDSPAA